jgi:glycosyltransferase involved in cell wall biosynthesis
MKILIVSPCFGTYGGIEAFVCALSAAIQNCSDLEFILCFKQTSSFRLDDMLSDHISKLGIKAVFVPRASPELLRYIRHVDLVHCQNPCIDVAIAAKFFRKPLVLTIHNYRNPLKSVREVVRYLAFLLADRRWYNSDFVWRTWEPHKKRPTSDKLPVLSNLPNGFVPISERKGFVFIARWIANKGIDTLLEAYRRARLDRSTWPLVLMGDGPLRPSIEDKIKNYKIQGVTILGRVDDAARNAVIRQARWMVTPPNTKEDMGLTPFESRHVGVPCIITRDGGLPEAGGRHALVCEPGDVQGLTSLLERASTMDEEEYTRISIATRQELLETLRPLSVYAEEYQKVLLPLATLL